MSREKIRETIETLADVKNKGKYIHIWINFVLVEKTKELEVEVSYNDKTNEYTMFLVDKKTYSIPVTIMEHNITNISFEVEK